MLDKGLGKLMYLKQFDEFNTGFPSNFAITAFKRKNHIYVFGINKQNIDHGRMLGIPEVINTNFSSLYNRQFEIENVSLSSCYNDFEDRVYLAVSVLNAEYHAYSSFIVSFNIESDIIESDMGKTLKYSVVMKPWDSKGRIASIWYDRKNNLVYAMQSYTIIYAWWTMEPEGNHYEVLIIKNSKVVGVRKIYHAFVDDSIYLEIDGGSYLLSKYVGVVLKLYSLKSRYSLPMHCGYVINDKGLEVAGLIEDNILMLVDYTPEGIVGYMSCLYNCEDAEKIIDYSSGYMQELIYRKSLTIPPGGFFELVTPDLLGLHPDWIPLLRKYNKLLVYVSTTSQPLEVYWVEASIYNSALDVYACMNHAIANKKYSIIYPLKYAEGRSIIPIDIKDNNIPAVFARNIGNDNTNLYYELILARL